ncbi:putative F-box protein At3g16210 [Neltuma alba]|uniref:putative F-box protein At3g16210 n=1 Tax=Neltuma alba TaxID=207710 RepID=UPI0010A323B7|nr:putative F-box protein At3g16210 [Prosopis alba]
MPTVQAKRLWLGADGFLQNTLIPFSMGRTVKPLRTFLPDGIIVNIFRRLPVKSLIRLQCVCKHWKNLIRSPFFTPVFKTLHFCRWPRPMSSGFHWVLLDRDMRRRVVQNSQISLIDTLPQLSIHGSSNGLLCLKSASQNSILLWNPATRESKQVPAATNRFGGHCCIGFGFSPIVNDYKIGVIYDHNLERVWRVYQVKVYSLCTRSWKEIEVGNMEGLYVNAHSVSDNGHAFWFGFKNEDDDYCSIVSFDIATEVFTLIPMPASDDRSFKYITGEMDLGSQYTSSACSGLSMLYPITIWGNKIICQPEFDGDSEDHEGEKDNDPLTPLYMFNIGSTEFRIFAIPSCNKGYGLTIDNYVESLVSIGNIHVENP